MCPDSCDGYAALNVTSSEQYLHIWLLGQAGQEITEWAEVSRVEKFGSDDMTVKVLLCEDLVGPLQPFSWPVLERCVKAMCRITVLPVVNNDPP